MKASEETARAPLRRSRGSGEDAFRVVVDERLRSLEEQVREVKTRVNGLLFFLAGTVAVQLLLGVLR
jgi:hypothetical protein